MPFDVDTFRLLAADAASDEAAALLESVGFRDAAVARRRLIDVAGERDESREAFAGCLPLLLLTLSDAAAPDGSLINFERFVQTVDDRAGLFRHLAERPRAVEILFRLFVGSQFLTEILIRNPEYLDKLTNHKRLADFKSREQFREEQLDAAAGCETLSGKLDELRRFQHWELLRIGACDSFGLMDLKAVTVQLSLLADSLVQSCLTLLAEELDVVVDDFSVLAFGKLGGEELNYSSDIDLVFLSRGNAPRFWTLGQRLIKALQESTGEGFMYRVDMRLRPWGSSGALVNAVDAHVEYLKKHGRLWEKQALLKARVIAGDSDVAGEFLARVEPLIYNVDAEAARENVREMKGKIEATLEKQGRAWGEVKSGVGSIRDVEFVTQYLQLVHGGRNRRVRSFNTLDALVRLVDFDIIQANEHRQLSTGYVFLRTIEHSLQLMHDKQAHSMPDDERGLAWLARRLDFSDVEQFLLHYRQHCRSIRAIYDKYIGGRDVEPAAVFTAPADPIESHLARMEPEYAEIFSDDEVANHVAMLSRLSDENVVEVDAQRVDGCDAQRGGDLWRVTIAGYNHPGELSLMCGLLFVYGFDITAGDVFTAEDVATTGVDAAGGGRTFVDVFTVAPSFEDASPDVWKRYAGDLAELFALVRSGRLAEAQGALAKRVAGALRPSMELGTGLFPIEVDVDNEASERATVVHIQAEDTIGFLYELTNATAQAEIDIERVVVSSDGNRVFDTLYVTDAAGSKITDENRLRQLRATVVLIKHFTHLLPRSPNPEAALLHFREFLEQQFQQPDWFRQMRSLERPEVLAALARLMGVSDFLWEDFLRVQHQNLFPVIADVESLAEPRPREVLERELSAELDDADGRDEKRTALNQFKDRAMFRADMRHILGRVTEFGQFSAELTDVAEVVVAAAHHLCDDRLRKRHGVPRVEATAEDAESQQRECPLSICALGKCGGRELGYASDIELMFVFEASGRTDGRESITNAEYFQRLVDAFRRTIEAREEGIFQIDLRLRPYGRAGAAAVTLDTFRQYFGLDGPAWPYERQALVKLRPIAGDRRFGDAVVDVRDELIYTERPFDATAMRAMRDKQLRQLVEAGTFNAKLSPGGLVDTEYLVQGLQITHGLKHPPVRATNTRRAMAALEDVGVLSPEEHSQLEEAYIFQRRLIDALRMVRGHAKDLSVPSADDEEFEFLARRLGYGADLTRLADDLENYSTRVLELGRLLETR